jgi:hypothetical protein
MSTFVLYNVPVLVEIDLDRAEVVSVRVDDEQADGPLDVISIDAGGVAAEGARRAAQIAESESWPAWELGF